MIANAKRSRASATWASDEIGGTDRVLVGEQTAKAFHGHRDSGEEHWTALRGHGESYSSRAPFRYP